MFPNDLDLLGKFSRDQSQDAFTTLVQRHLDLVYCAALRQVRSPQLAEEVAQSVFTDLARNAGRLKSDTILAAWLYQVTRRTAINVVRSEARRQLREQTAFEQNLMNATAVDWTHIEPFLDEAMHALDETDRTAVLLRYFENKSLRELGQILGMSDDAAQKRVSRAVERLRALLGKRGVSAGASGLVLVICANAVQAAPAGLALTISTAASLIGATIATSASTTATKAIAMTTAQKILVAAMVAAAIGTGIYEARRASHASDLVNLLQLQQAALNEQIQQLTREREEAARRLAASPNETDRLNRVVGELLKLRGEVSRLRATAMPTIDDPTQTAAQAWLKRVNQLKEYLEQHPEGRIPELQFVTDDDWLRVTMNVFETENNSPTDGAYRRAMVSLRNSAKNKFSTMARTALKSYALTHDHQFPKETSELTAHFAAPIDDATLQRYAIFPTATFKDIRVGGDWVMAEIASPDEELDYRYVIGADGSDTVAFKQSAANALKAQMEGQIQPLIETLEPVAKAYAAAHEGRPPPDPEQMTPYATTPEQQAALQKLIEIRKQTVSGVSPARPGLEQSANGRK